MDRHEYMILFASIWQYSVTLWPFLQMFDRNTCLMNILAFKINSRDWSNAWYSPNSVMLMMGCIRTELNVSRAKV